MTKTRKISFANLASLLSLASCRSPLSSLGLAEGLASLTFSIAVPEGSASLAGRGGNSARVILPDTSSVSITVTWPKRDPIVQSVAVAAGTAELSLEDLPSGLPIVIHIEAKDAGGTVYASYNGSITLRPGANTCPLVLLPGTVTTVSPAWSRGLSGSAAGVTFYQLNVPDAGTWGFTVDKAGGGFPTSQILAWGLDGRALASWEASSYRGSATVTGAGAAAYLGVYGTEALDIRLAKAPAGEADSGFGRNGVAKAWGPARSHDARIESAAVFPDGRIALCGYMVDGSIEKAFVSMLSANGAMVQEFGAGGAMAFSVRGEEYARIVAAEVDSGGRLVVGGYVGSGGDQDFFTARILTSGELDASFGIGGIVVLDPYALNAGLPSSTSTNTLTGLALDATGRVLLAGSCTGSGTSDWIVARYTASGTLDTSFGYGSTGTTTFATGVPDSCRGVATIGDDVVLFGSYSSFNSAVVRLRADGFPYTTAPWTGLPVDLSINTTQAMALRDVDSDGVPELYLAGRVATSAYVYRFRLDTLALDTAYTPIGGRQVSGMDADVTSLAVGPDGSCLVFATSPVTTFETYAVKLDASGVIELAFEQSWSQEIPTTNGLIGMPIETSSLGDRSAKAIALPSGRWLLTGSAYIETQTRWRGYALILEASGAFYNAFDGDGIASGATLRENLEYRAAASLEDGRVVAAGQYWEGGVQKAFFDLYAADGQSAVRSVLHQGGMTRSTVGAATLGPDGSVYIGWTFEEPENNFAISKVGPSGAYDTSYGVGGQASHYDPDFLEYKVASLAIGADGTGFLGGQAIDTGVENLWVLLRFGPSGTLEWGGIKTVNNNQQGGTDCVTGISIAPDGSVYIAGTTFDMISTADENAFAARYSPAGIIDLGFDHDGTSDGVYYLGLESKIAGTDIDSASGISVDRDGTTIVYGSARTGIEPFTGVGWSIRLRADGTVDSAYGTDGVARLGSGATGVVGGSLHPDGSVVVAGAVDSVEYIGRFSRSGLGTRTSSASLSPANSSILSVDVGSGGDVLLAGFGYTSGVTYGFVSRAR
ncbi:MAG: hypothetical protein KKB59_00485 [Spirochaetes bacterium]|nr:hypothetical protein [Spirochaetota bacterium]